MVDWSQAFERQSHVLGIQSFIKNGVRKSLIPLLINFFQDRYIKVKWNETFSSDHTVKGGGPQGGNAGILEYISLTAGNMNHLDCDDAFKFVDDASFIELLNIAMLYLSYYDVEQHVPSDISTEKFFLPTEKTKSQKNLDKLSEWTTQNEMKLNPEKTKYMIINFCKSTQFNTRLSVNKSIIDQVSQIARSNHF